MEIYGLRQKKKKKWWLIPVLIAAGILLAIFAIGVTVNITNADHDTITASVRENAELKRQIEDLNAQIKGLEEQLTDAHRELDARPTAEPEPTAASETPEPERQGTSPRNFD